MYNKWNTRRNTLYNIGCREKINEIERADCRKLKL